MACSIFCTLLCITRRLLLPLLLHAPSWTGAALDVPPPDARGTIVATCSFLERDTSAAIAQTPRWRPPSAGWMRTRVPLAWCNSQPDPHVERRPAMIEPPDSPTLPALPPLASDSRAVRRGLSDRRTQGAPERVMSGDNGPLRDGTSPWSWLLCITRRLLLPLLLHAPSWTGAALDVPPPDARGTIVATCSFLERDTSAAIAQTPRWRPPSAGWMRTRVPLAWCNSQPDPHVERRPAMIEPPDSPTLPALPPLASDSRAVRRGLSDRRTQGAPERVMSGDNGPLRDGTSPWSWL